MTRRKEGKQAYIDQLDKMSNSTKLGIELGRDVIATLPLGELVDEKIGLNELVSKIFLKVKQEIAARRT